MFIRTPNDIEEVLSTHEEMILSIPTTLYTTTKLHYFYEDEKITIADNLEDLIDAIYVEFSKEVDVLNFYPKEDIKRYRHRFQDLVVKGYNVYGIIRTEKELKFVVRLDKDGNLHLI